MNDFKEILNNPWYASIVIFFTQIFLIYWRTINILFITNKNITGAIWTNNLGAILSLISMSIGVNSIYHSQWVPIIFFLLGGSIGTYFGVKKDIKLDKKNERQG